MIRKSLRLLAPALIALFGLSSCFQVDSTVRLKKDGSGTITEEVVLGAQMLAMMEQMAGLGGEGADKKDPLDEMMTPEKAAESAKTKGEGVTVDKVEKINEGGRKGFRVVYKFTDINKLKVVMGQEGEAGAASKEQPVTFTYADGKLTIKNPEPKKAEDAGEAKEGELNNPEMMAQAKEMFKDMRVVSKLVIEPGIAKTNATYVQGDTITLADIDFGKIVANEKGMEALKKLDPQDPAKFQEAIKGIEGVKFEAQREVTVDLK